MAVKQSPWVGLANALGGAYGASQQEQVDALRAKDAQERQKFLSDAVSQYGSDPKTLSQALISKPEFTAAGLSLLGDSIKGDQLTAYQAAMLGMQSQKFQAEYPPDPRTGQPKKPVKPTVRDEIEMSKARDASDKAIQTQNIISEAEPILQRYETSKATPVVGFMGQVANAIGIAGDETKQKVQDFESLNRISKELGIATLQQFGGNDTDRELMAAIQIKLDPTALPETTLKNLRQQKAAATVLEKKPAFMEEWVSKAGALNSPDPVTGETFSTAWKRTQRELYRSMIGEQPAQTKPVELSAPLPDGITEEDVAEYKKRLEGR
jgi:hypothetical protein